MIPKKYLNFYIISIFSAVIKLNYEKLLYHIFVIIRFASYIYRIILYRNPIPFQNNYRNLQTKS